MATATLLPLAEYLQTTYRPDREFIDGELQERNRGEIPHSALQSFFCWLFRDRRADWRMRAYPEQRVQVAPTRFRIPDVCLVPLYEPIGLILTAAPSLCIEILSRDDSMTDMLTRVDDYQRVGVPAVWVIDPWGRKAYRATPDGSLLHEPDTLRVPGTAIEVSVAAIFQELEPTSPE